MHGTTNIKFVVFWLETIVDQKQMLLAGSVDCIYKIRKTGNILMYTNNVTLRLVLLTIVAMEDKRTYSEYVFVVFGIRHAKRMLHVICLEACPAVQQHIIS